MPTILVPKTTTIKSPYQMRQTITRLSVFTMSIMNKKKLQKGHQSDGHPQTSEIRGEQIVNKTCIGKQTADCHCGLMEASRAIVQCKQTADGLLYCRLP